MMTSQTSNRAENARADFPPLFKVFGLSTPAASYLLTMVPQDCDPQNRLRMPVTLMDLCMSH